MSTPISPAIIIQENFDARPTIPVGYNVMATGFTSEGIANEPFVFNRLEDFLARFGEPDPSRKEQIYSYETAKRVIESGSNLVFVKLPYGAKEGYEVGEEYSAILYPALEDDDEGEAVIAYEAIQNFTADLFGGTLSSVSPFSSDVVIGQSLTVSEALSAHDEYTALSSTTLSGGGADPYDTDNFIEVTGLSSCKGYVLGEPVRIDIDQAGYDALECGKILWEDDYPNFDSSITSFDPVQFGKVGLIVLDNGRSKSLDSREGYYVSVTDNTDGDPANDWSSIVGIKNTLSTGLGNAAFQELPTDSYSFDLTLPYTDPKPSISQSLAAISEQSGAVNDSWADGKHKNFLSVALWRLNKDLQNGSDELIPILVESHTGSISDTETVITEGGYQQNVFIQDVIDGDSNRLKVFVNPNISGDIYNVEGAKVKNLRMWREELKDSDLYTSSFKSTALSEFGPSAIVDGFSDSLYSVSRYTPKQERSACDVGNVPKKIRNALCTVDNPDRVTIDLSVEAGLGTIWNTVREHRPSWLTGNLEDESFCFDDEVFIDVIGDLGRGDLEGSERGNMRLNWTAVFQEFLNFTEKVRLCNGGYHHLHVADTLRHILVNGRDCKVYDSKTKCKNPGVFASDVYWPSKNLTKLVNNTVTTLDAQWYKSSNIYSSSPVWIPASPVTAGLMAETPFPWLPAAGVRRGVIRDVVDVAIDPVLRDRDYLYKIKHNATFYDRNTAGFLRFADQTMLKNDNHQLRNNSARRLLVWLEKNLQNALRPFLFEPNNLQTRIRFKNEIELYLDTLLINGAIEDFAVSLSKNTPTSQQEGCLIADITIKITGIVTQIKLNLNLARLDQGITELF